jgi:hypothetical protein
MPSTFDSTGNVVEMKLHMSSKKRIRTETSDWIYI